MNQIGSSDQPGATSSRLHDPGTVPRGGCELGSKVTLVRLMLGLMLSQVEVCPTEETEVSIPTC